MSSTAGILVMLIPVMTPVLDILYPLNSPRVKEHLFRTEYFVDEQEHYYKIYLHFIFCMVLIVWIIVAIACFFSNLSQQAIGVTKSLM